MNNIKKEYQKTILLIVLTIALSIGMLTNICASTPTSYSINYQALNSTLTYPGGGTMGYTYDTLVDNIKQPSQIISTDPVTGVSGTTAITYDGKGQPDMVTDANGNVTQYTYGVNTYTSSNSFDSNLGLLLSKKSAKGTPIELDTVYNWNDQLRLPNSIQYSNGLTESFEYGWDATLLQMSLSDSNATEKWHYTYNNQYALETIQAPWFSSGKTHIDYNAAGNISAISNPLGQLITFTKYSANGNLLSMTDLNGISHSFTYNADNQLLSQSISGDSLPERNPSIETHYTYDDNGKLSSTTDPDNITQRFSMNYWGHLKTLTDSNGNTVNFTLNSLGKPTLKTIIDKATAKTLYSKSLSYDGLGRLHSITDSDNHAMVYVYDKAGNLGTIINGKGNSSTLGYNAQNQLHTNQNALTHTMSYDHDKMGSVTGITDFNGHTTTYTRNPLSQITQIDSPVSGTTTFTYDQSTGLLTTKLDANDNMLSYTYDAIGRLKSISDGRQQTISNTYDQGAWGKGHLSKVNVTNAQLIGKEFGYNQRGSITTITDDINGKTYTTHYTYTPAQRIKTLTYPDGKQITYGYNSDGRVNAITLGDNNTTLVNQITYLPFGPMRQATFGNGALLARTFNQNYQLTRQTVSNVDDDQYLYDANGNITTFTDNKNPHLAKTYTYDAINRLKSVTEILSSSYDYDNNDNRISKDQNSISKETYQYDVNNDKLKTITNNGTPEEVSHDANGNITQLGNLHFEYNDFNQLIITRTQVAQNNNVIAMYAYNGLGQRMVKSAQVRQSVMVPGQSYQQTLFIYGQNNKLLEIKTSTTTMDFIYLNDEPLALIKNDQIYYYINNALGTPKYLTDQSNNTQWQADIQPFQLKELNQNIDQPLRFPGQIDDQTTGLIYNSSRYYLPTLGRYLQPDLSGLAGSYNNLYSYTGQNPVNLIDPTGLFGATSKIDNTTLNANFMLPESWRIGNLFMAIGFFDGVDAAAIVADDVGATEEGLLCGDEAAIEYDSKGNIISREAKSLTDEYAMTNAKSGLGDQLPLKRTPRKVCALRGHI